MNLDPALAMADGTTPSACPCPCRSYGHATCDRPAETVYANPGMSFLTRSNDREPMCQPCADARGALHSAAGATVVLSFPARENTVFAEGTFDALVGKPMNIMATPAENIAGFVRAAVIAQGGRTVEVTVESAHLVAATFPTPVPAPESLRVP